MGRHFGRAALAVGSGGRDDQQPGPGEVDRAGVQGVTAVQLVRVARCRARFGAHQPAAALKPGPAALHGAVRQAGHRLDPGIAGVRFQRPGIGALVHGPGEQRQVLALVGAAYSGDVGERIGQPYRPGAAVYPAAAARGTPVMMMAARLHRSGAPDFGRAGLAVRRSVMLAPHDSGRCLAASVVMRGRLAFRSGNLWGSASGPGGIQLSWRSPRLRGRAPVLSATSWTRGGRYPGLVSRAGPPGSPTARRPACPGRRQRASPEPPAAAQLGGGQNGEHGHAEVDVLAVWLVVNAGDRPIRLCW